MNKNQTTQVGIPNPNGIRSPSPGLRRRAEAAIWRAAKAEGTSYPGSIVEAVSNPEEVVSFGSRRCSVTPLGLNDQSNYASRVVAPLKPWAECHSPFGTN